MSGAPSLSLREVADRAGVAMSSVSRVLSGHPDVSEAMRARVMAVVDELGYEPHEAVFLGDSPHDIKSGNAAGVTTIAALWGPFTRNQLDPYKPNLFLESITDLPAAIQRIQAGAIAGRTPRDGTRALKKHD